MKVTFGTKIEIIIFFRTNSATVEVTHTNVTFTPMANGASIFRKLMHQSLGTRFGSYQTRRFKMVFDLALI